MKLPVLAFLLCAIHLCCYAQQPAEKTTDAPKEENSNPEPPKGITILPAKIHFGLNSGATATRTVKVANKTSDTIHFKTYLADWGRDSFGGHKYFHPGSQTRSCARWISLDKTFLELKPGETQEIAVKMEVPDSAESVKEMKWTMLFVETKPEKIFSDKHLKVGKNARVGVHIYQTPPSLTNAEVRILNFFAEPGSDTSYRVICKNVGDVQFEPKCYMELTPSDREGAKITVSAKPFPLFPEQVRNVTLTIPKTVPKGKYNAIAIVEAGGDTPLEAARAEIEVK